MTTYAISISRKALYNKSFLDVEETTQIEQEKTATETTLEPMIILLSEIYTTLKL